MEFAEYINIGYNVDIRIGTGEFYGQVRIEMLKFGIRRCAKVWIERQLPGRPWTL